MSETATSEKDSIITIYMGELLKNTPPLFFLEKMLKQEEKTEKNLWNMFQGSPGEASFDFLRIVPNPQDADFLLFPHNYFSLRMETSDTVKSFISHFVTCAEKCGKKILVFAMADSDEAIEIPHSLIFRYSQYRYKKRDNEILTPPYPLHERVAELSRYRERVWKNIILRQKNQKPVVSFCGWAGFPNEYRRFTHGVRTALADFRTYILGDEHAGLHKSGIYWRRKAMRALLGSSRITMKFLVRKSYSAQKGFNGKDSIRPEDAEREYIESILNTDFVLAPKGHGNASVRFYEALSLGRFPVLIDTDCVLPLEDIVDYSQCVVTVPDDRLEDAEKLILNFYNSLSDEQFKERQKMARALFELLRPASFLKIVLSELKRQNPRYT